MKFATFLQEFSGEGGDLNQADETP